MIDPVPHNSPYAFEPLIPLPSLWEEAGRSALLALKILREGAPYPAEVTVTSSRNWILVSFKIEETEATPTALALSPCSDGDKADITLLIRKLSDAWVVKLAFVQAELASIGDRIAHLHPLTFMKVVLSDPDLKTRFKSIFNSPPKRWGWINGNGLGREGFWHQFEREHGRGALEPYVRDFATSLHLPEDEIMRLIQAREWERLNFYLIEKTCS